MKVFGLNIPDDKGLTNIDLCEYARELGIEKFRGVFMRDTLPKIPHRRECGIVNFNTSRQQGSHWVCYYKDGKNKRIYFDSFGQVAPMEIRKYLKTKKESGHLCLFVLRSSTREHRSFQDILNELNDGYTQCNWETTAS